MFRKAQFEATRDDSGRWSCRVTPVPTVDEIERGTSEDLRFTELQDFLDGNRDEAAGEVNWAGSGSAVVLRMRDGVYLPVGFRDAGAPTYAEHLCTASGIADTMRELLEPRRLSIKELDELMMYNEAEESWLLPVENDYFDRPTHPELSEKAQQWKQQSEYVATDKLTDVEAHFREIGEDELGINHPDKDGLHTLLTGQLVLDEHTKNLDLVDVIELSLPNTSIEDIRFFDGEAVDGTLLDRPIYLFRPEQYMRLFIGERVTATRKMQSGLYYDGEGYTAAYQDGIPVEELFDGVPTLAQSHDAVCRYLREEVLP